MNGFIPSIVVPLFVLGLAAGAEGQARRMSDAELDTVTAGSAATKDESLPATAQPPVEFTFAAPAGTRHTVSGTGSVQVTEQQGAAAREALVIRDQAQQNLQSFINVTAVNSLIQVLVNLNITINSTVGSVQQLNVSGPAAGP